MTEIEDPERAVVIIKDSSVSYVLAIVHVAPAARTVRRSRERDPRVASTSRESDRRKAPKSNTRYGKSPSPTGRSHNFNFHREHRERRNNHHQRREREEESSQDSWTLDRDERTTLR